MSVKSIRGLSLGLAVWLLVSGCAHTPGGISASSTPIEGRAYTILGPASGNSSCVRLFGFIPVSSSSTIRAALNSAIRDKRGDALIEVTVESFNHHYILFSRHVVRVEGVAIRFQN